MKSKSPFKQDKCTVAWEKWTVVGYEYMNY